jgi:hypothetical protein
LPVSPRAAGHSHPRIVFLLGFLQRPPAPARILEQTDPWLATDRLLIYVISCVRILLMPNDAKLGLVIGLAVVIAIGVVFYRKEPANSPAANHMAGSTDSAVEGARPSRSPRGRPVTRGENSSGPSGVSDADVPAIEAVAPDQQPAAPE